MPTTRPGSGPPSPLLPFSPSPFAAMSIRETGSPHRAIGWALLGQVIWLPLVAIAVHDRWLTASSSPPSAVRSLPSAGSASAPPLSLSDVTMASPSARQPGDAAVRGTATVVPAASPRSGLVLSSAAPQPAIQAAPPKAESSSRASHAGGAAAEPPELPGAHHETARPRPVGSAPVAPGSSMRRASPSGLLGGPVALRDLPKTMLSMPLPRPAASGGASPADGDRPLRRGAEAFSGFRTGPDHGPQHLAPASPPSASVHSSSATP